MRGAKDFFGLKHNFFGVGEGVKNIWLVFNQLLFRYTCTHVYMYTGQAQFFFIIHELSSGTLYIA